MGSTLGVAQPKNGLDEGFEMSGTELEQARAELAALEAEYADLDKRIPEMESALKAAKLRFSDLKSIWGGNGLIKQQQSRVARLEIADQDARLPRITTVTWLGISEFVIVDVDAKWITLRRPGGIPGDETSYRRSDGRKRGSREGGYDYDYPIDVARAMEIWERHQEQVKGEAV